MSTADTVEKMGSERMTTSKGDTARKQVGSHKVNPGPKGTGTSWPCKGDEGNVKNNLPNGAAACDALPTF